MFLLHQLTGTLGRVVLMGGNSPGEKGLPSCVNIVIILSTHEVALDLAVSG